MRCPKPRGERNAPRDPDRQTAHSGAPIDPFNALGTAKAIRVVWAGKER